MNYKIKTINKNEYFLQIIDELRKEYGVQRKGDTYMSEEKLEKLYSDFVNKEFEVSGVFEEDRLLGFNSYKITEDGLYCNHVLIFKENRGNNLGALLMNYLEEYAKQNNCEQIYLGARRSANNFYFKLGYEGSCLIQSDKATKDEMEKLMKKYGVLEYDYNLYQGCNPPINQIRVNAKYINNSKLLEEIDNSDLDIGCILTFSKKIENNKNL